MKASSKDRTDWVIVFGWEGGLDDDSPQRVVREIAEQLGLDPALGIYGMDLSGRAFRTTDAKKRLAERKRCSTRLLALAEALRSGKANKVKP